MYNAYVPRGGIPVTPSDTTELGPPIPTGFFVGGAGNVAVLTEDGSALTYIDIPEATQIAMRIRKIMFTGTTATNIIATY